MNITKKLDRAFQWAGEKMGGEAKTAMSEDFKLLETEMALRFDGMERLQRSMNQYVKWIGRHLDPSEDREKALPVGYLGRTMVSHGEEFQADSEFGNCLISMGRTNERVSAIQEAFVSEATTLWLESLERSLAMMREYQTARKKLESRRLAYDASISKVQKAKRDDFRLEEELRAAKAKYEETSEDVVRRMQDIQDAELDSVRDLTHFLDAELEYHERCAEELRRARNNWPGTAGPVTGYGGGIDRSPSGRGRSNMAHSHTERLQRKNSYIAESARPEESGSPPIRMPPRLSVTCPNFSQPQNQQAADGPARPSIGNKSSSSFQGGARLDRERERLSAVNNNIPNVGALRGQLRPVSRIMTTTARDDDDEVVSSRGGGGGGRDDDTASDAGSASWGNRSMASSTTSVRSLSYTPSISAAVKKAPPPPPPSRSKKPPPPVPARRLEGY